MFVYAVEAKMRLKLKLMSIVMVPKFVSGTLMKCYKRIYLKN